MKYDKQTYIGKSVSIGANATIVCGVTIGEYALVGSGAVVTKDVPPYSLVIGNPGRIVGKVDEKGNIWFLSGADSDHNVNIKHDSFVQLIYSKPGSMEFLSIYADAAIITDRKPIEELYEKTDDTYFDGIDDPNITALSITPLEARYWEPKNNKFITLLKMAKGAITGEKADVGQSGKLLV